MNKATYTLRVKKVKRIENDGKPDTFSVSLDGLTNRGVTLTLTATADDLDSLRETVSTFTGDILEMELTPVQYGDITSYGTAVKATMDAAEAHEILEALTMQPDPYQPITGQAPSDSETREALAARRAAYAAQEAPQ